MARHVDNAAHLTEPPPRALATPRNRNTQQGKIKEGGEGDVRASVFVVALTREVDPESGALTWRAAEIAFSGGQLFL